jgi:autotransporter-associated beta strand protein
MRIPSLSPLFAAALPGLSPSLAAEHFWNVGGTGGPGVWGTGPGDKNWNSSVGAAGPNFTWPDAAGDVANFQDPLGGIVTVFGSVRVSGIVLQGANYSLEGGSLTLVPDLAANVPAIDVRSGILAIGTTLEGAAGLTKQGSGELRLSGLNDYAGDTMVAGGTLLLDAAEVLPDSTVLHLSTGTTLTLGTGNESITGLISNGATISGPGVLTASSYLLNDGTTVTGKLGGGTLESQGGVNLIGSSAAGTVSVVSGTLTLAGNNLTDGAQLGLASGSTLFLQGSQTVGHLVSSGGLIAGPGTLSAALYELNGGTSVTGNLGDGGIETRGAVSISGSTGAGSLTVASGTLSYSGSSSATTVTIANGATLQHSGSLANTAALVNSGAMFMNVSDTVGTYVSQGGSLSGSGTLTASSYLLNEGSSVSGNLVGGLLVSQGAVILSGSSDAGIILVASGMLDNRGVLGNSLTQLDIASGATLIAGGTQNFALLSTSGGGSGTWQGSLANGSTVAPGGLGAAGALRVEGDFVNGPGGTLVLDVGVAASDVLDVTGTAAFGGSLDLRKSGAGEIELLVPVQLIRAGSYVGNFSSLTEDLEGLVLFNPANGSITRITLEGNASLLAGVSNSRTSTWLALYDDVIDPGVSNVVPRPGGSPPFDLTSGIASTTDPDLLWSLAASLTPSGLDPSLLDRLSPAVYTSLPEYALQATRTHRRSAFRAPSVVSAAAPSSSGKDAKGVAVFPVPGTWEVFAAADFFDVETSDSAGQADFGLTGAGVVTGVRTELAGGIRAGAYFGADDGEISGRLIDADGDGWTFGLTGEVALGPKKATRILAGAAYGSYRFDGTRGSAIATAAGWRPGVAGFSDVTAEAFDVFAGVETLAYDSGTFRLIPAMGISYSSGSAEAFREIARNTPGSPVTLAVDPVHRESFLAEFSVAAEADVSRTVTLDGQVGLNVGFNDDPEHVTARFSAAGRAQTVEGSLLSDDLLFIGMGATWSAADDVRVRLGYRAEFRSGAEVFNGLNLGATIGF